MGRRLGAWAVVLAALAGVGGCGDDDGADPGAGAGGSAPAGSAGAGYSGSGGSGGSGGSSAGAGGGQAGRGGSSGQAGTGGVSGSGGVGEPIDREAEVVAANEAAPLAMVDDGTSIYWATAAGASPRLRRAPKAGGPAETVYASTPVRSRSLAFASGKLFWADLDAGAVRSGEPGASAPGAPLASGLAGLRRVGVAAGKVLFTVGPWDGFPSGAVRSLPLVGGAPTEEAGGQFAPDWVTADEGGVAYWIDTNRREVRRSAAGGHESVAAIGVESHAVQLVGGRVFWDDVEQGSVWSAPTSSVADRRLELSGQGWVSAFAVAGTTLYALTNREGRYEVWQRFEGAAPARLCRVPAASIAPNAAEGLGALGLLVDESYVYFADAGTVDPFASPPTTAGDGTVYRVAR